MGHRTSPDHPQIADPVTAIASRVTVALDDASRNDPGVWDSVVRKLKAHGLEVSRELNVVGIVAGMIPPDAIDALKGEAHVTSVVSDERRSVQ